MGAGRKTFTYDFDTRWAAQGVLSPLQPPLWPGRAAGGRVVRPTVHGRRCQPAEFCACPMLCRCRNETNYRFEQQQKNLGSQLGGVIFSERTAGRAALRCGRALLALPWCCNR